MIGASIDETKYELTEAEQKEKRKLAGLRARQQERARRFIQEPWNRMTGVDKAGIETQLSAKAAQKAKDREQDLAFARQQKQVLALLNAQELRNQRDKAEMKKQMARDWEYQMREKEQRERKADAEAKLGAGGALVFQGEDLYSADRKALQKMQMRRWVAQQSAENAERRGVDKQASVDYAEKLRVLGEYRDALEKYQKSQQKAENYATAAANKQLAAQAQADRKRVADEQFAEKVAVLQWMQSDPFLSEDKSQDASALSATRVRPDHFKGFKDTQYDQIYQTRANQITEGKIAAADAAVARRREKDLVAKQAAMTSIMTLQEEDAMRAAKVTYSSVLAEQVRESDARSQAARVSRNASGMNDNFFGYFGKSAR